MPTYQEPFYKLDQTQSTQSRSLTKIEKEYSPKTNILSTWYNILTNPIIQQEITNTINISPNSKAQGPTLISNEMLKHTHSHITKLFTILFNKCLDTTNIPTA